MANSRGRQLAENIRRSIEELKNMYAGLDEKIVSRAPEGRWSPKEILSHLLGPEGRGHIPTLRVFLDQEIPEIDIEPENPFFSENRARMSCAQLLSEVEVEYGRIASFAAELSADQLQRKAHIPKLKGSPFGEYPTLETWLGLLGGSEKSHVRFHIDHLREILQSLGA